MITTLTGKNSFLLIKEYRQLVDNFIAEFSDLAIEKLDGQEADTPHMVEAMESMSFLSSNKLVVLSSPSAQRDFTDNFSKIIDRVPYTTDILIIEPKLDKRSVYAKELKKLTQYHEFNDLDDEDLVRWLVDEVKAQQGSLTSSDARYLVSRVGANQQLLYNELDKLVTYRANIDRQTIDQLTEEVPQSSIFQLLEAAFGGDVAKALKLYDEQRRQKVEPQAILALIAWQLHVLALVATGGGRSDDEIAREAKISPYVVRKSRSIVRSIGGGMVKVLVNKALELDVKLKTVSIDADDALQNFVISIAS